MGSLGGAAVLAAAPRSRAMAVADRAPAEPNTSGTSSRRAAEIEAAGGRGAAGRQRRIKKQFLEDIAGRKLAESPACARR